MSDVTHILTAIERGDPQAAEKLLPLVYEDLCKLAAHRMTLEEAPNVLGMSARTANNYWAHARAWLFHEFTVRGR